MLSRRDGLHDGTEVLHAGTLSQKTNWIFSDGCVYSAPMNRQHSLLLASALALAIAGATSTAAGGSAAVSLSAASAGQAHASAGSTGGGGAGVATPTAAASVAGAIPAATTLARD